MDYKSFQPGDQNQNQVPVVPEASKIQNLSERLRPYRWHIAISGVVIIALLLGAYGYLKYTNQQNDATVAKQAEDAQKKIDEIYQKRENLETYRNNLYGFSIALPDSWNGYTVLNSQWEGRDVATGNVVERGPIITMRHPQWTAVAQREDMPVMVFNPTQWQLVQQEKIAVSAAPIPPSVLGQNSRYIMALPPRYNYDYKTGWEEVDQLVHTLRLYEPATSEQFCGGIAGVACPSGYDCKLDGSYPDAGGTCIKVGVACTQEAKQCSDGSYVSRTGPNCEFATCPGDGTLTGHITIGPNCPVERPGVPCTPAPEAYTSRRVYVYKADGKTLVMAQNFDVQGNYSIALPAGNYVVESRTGISSTPNLVGSVAIKTGQITTLNFSIDTGIR